jgi:hypothetical protein
MSGESVRIEASGGDMRDVMARLGVRDQPDVGVRLSRAYRRLKDFNSKLTGPMFRVESAEKRFAWEVTTVEAAMRLVRRELTRWAKRVEKEMREAAHKAAASRKRGKKGRRQGATAKKV